MCPYVNLNIKVCYVNHHLFDHYADYHLFDHYTDQHLFDHCADHHLSDHHANIIQLSELSSCIVQLFTCISIHTKLIFLFVILKDAEYQRNPHVKCTSHCICYSIVKYYIMGREKEVLGRTWNWRTRCTALCSLHIELYVCMFYWFLLWSVNVYLSAQYWGQLWPNSPTYARFPNLLYTAELCI